MKTAPTCIIAVGVLLLGNPLTHSAEPSMFSLQLNKARDIRGVKIPLGTENNSKPTATVYMGAISVESKRAGFLRLGPIPQPVISGMRVDILEPEGRTGWAADFARFATGEAALERVNIRGVAIVSSGRAVVSVHADTAKFIAGTRTLRMHGVQVHEGDRMLHQFISGDVYLDGPKAGRIEWREGEHVRSMMLSGVPSAPGTGVSASLP